MNGFNYHVLLYAEGPIHLAAQFGVHHLGPVTTAQSYLMVISAPVFLSK